MLTSSAVCQYGFLCLTRILTLFLMMPLLLVLRMTLKEMKPLFKKLRLKKSKMKIEGAVEEVMEEMED